MKIVEIFQVPSYQNIKRLRYLFSFVFFIAFTGVRIVWCSSMPYSKPENTAQEEVICLNGTWKFTPVGSPSTTIKVPGFYTWKTDNDIVEDPAGRWRVVPDHPDAVYETLFSVPVTMAGKSIYLRFEGVNFLANISVNSQFAGSHGGGQIPFEKDITALVAVPSRDTLRVTIRYNTTSFLYGGKPLWPIGNNMHENRLGIVENVFLIGRPQQFIENIHVQTSVRQNLLTSNVSVLNTAGSVVQADIDLWIEDNGTTVLSFRSQSVALAAADTTVLNFSQGWSSASLWSPENPKLYDLICRLVISGSTIHQDTVRFGFREFWISGRHYILNGTPIHLLGDSFVMHASYQYYHYLLPNKSIWPCLVDTILALNYNVLRFHSTPAPEWLIEECDRKGLLVIYESAIFCDYSLPTQNKTYIKNASKYQKEMVRAMRNHPSIIIWSAENEMISFGGTTFTIPQILQFGQQAILPLDPSRPVMYEGDHDLEGQASIYSIHYPYGFPNGWPSGSIYQIGTFLSNDKPTSIGEFEIMHGTIADSAVVRRQAIKTRICRSLDFKDIRPYRLDWTFHPDPDYSPTVYRGFKPSRKQIQFTANTMNPVAVFDSSYYEYSIFPIAPSYDEGQTIRRRLHIFNDELSDPDVTFRWAVVLNADTVESGVLRESIPPGTFIRRTIQFTAPCVLQKNFFRLHLTSYKKGQRRFFETLLFSTRDIGLGPPQRVTALLISRQNNEYRIQWPSVKKNIDGNPNTITRYTLYRSPSIFFPASATQVISGIKDTTCLDVLPSVVGKPEENAFYRAVAENNLGLFSESSDIFGAFDFDINVTDRTDFNEIALNLNDTYRKASDLTHRIAGANSVVKWNAQSQGYEQYIPEIPQKDFNLAPGQSYFVNATRDTVFSLYGKPVFPVFHLITTATTDFNKIMIPLDREDIDKASDLLADIPNCNSAAFWDAGTQGYMQYSPALPVTNFDVRTGYPYFINITDETYWPPNKPGKTIEAGSAQTDSSSHAPHLVWGRIPPSAQFSGFKAFICTRPLDRVTENSAGCSLTDDCWIVQCASFGVPWKAGETLRIVLTGSKKNPLTMDVQLTYDPENSIPFPDSEQPVRFSLEQNFPNPFNSNTVIPMNIPESGDVLLVLYNTSGQEVVRLIDSWRDPGIWEVTWDGLDKNGKAAPSGIYIARFMTRKAADHIKLILAR